MDFSSEIYPPDMILASVANHLKEHHRDLRVSLGSNHVVYEDALAATLGCVSGMPDRVLLPTTNPNRREALRRKALENRALENTPPFSSSRPIRTTGKLDSADFPHPLSPDRRAALKKKALNENDPPPPRAFLLELRALRTENTLTQTVDDGTDTPLAPDTPTPPETLPTDFSRSAIIEALYDLAPDSFASIVDMLSDCYGETRTLSLLEADCVDIEAERDDTADHLRGVQSRLSKAKVNVTRMRSSVYPKMIAIREAIHAIEDAKIRDAALEMAKPLLDSVL
ncbi:hypothetical protein N7454_007927 [Penicillium verhagenii]|nr:hypothetical protein N7454_007927 [Penicillium verhagenii]